MHLDWLQLDSLSWLPGGVLSVPRVPRGPKCFCDGDTGIGNYRYVCIYNIPWDFQSNDLG